MVIAYHLSKSDLEVSTVSTLPVDLLKEEMASGKFPEVHLAQCVTHKEMILAHRAVGGLPELIEIDQICILHE